MVCQITAHFGPLVAVAVIVGVIVTVGVLVGVLVMVAVLVTVGVVVDVGTERVNAFELGEMMIPVSDVFEAFRSIV
jgi:hypothetical protein